MKRKLTLYTAIICLVTTNLFSQKSTISTPVKPKLVVGIIVDQMKYDYIYRYWNKFGNGGFKRLVNAGYLCTNTHYNYVPTYTGPGHASVYTGCTPATHGIVGNDWYMRETRDTVYCVEDSSVQTVGAANVAGKMSPRNLITTTITDELRLSTNFRSKVIGISMKDRGAILPAGHSANAAYWYDALTGNWITSSYYMNDLPQWVKDFNAKKLSDKYINTIWNTLLPIESYTESTVDDTPYEGNFFGETKPVFPHDFPKIKSTNYELIRRSPWGNSLTKDFAIQSISDEKLGSDSITDFLAISFSCTDYVGHQFGTNAIETEDTYLRLDKDIEELLNYLDKNIGKQNVLMFLTADHAAIPNPQYLIDNKIPSGWFDFKPMIDSLKKVFIKYYADSNLFLSFDNDQIYLNHDLCDAKNINIKQLQNQVADFVVKFNGVANALSASRLSEMEFTEGVNHLVQMGFNRKRSGDVAIELEPGLIEWFGKTGTTHGSPYSYDTHVPLIWYGWKILAGKNSHPIETTDIAATLAQLLQIEFPNGCIGKPINDLVDY